MLKCRIWILLFFFMGCLHFCGQSPILLSAYPINFDNIKKEERAQYVINDDKLLSPKEAYRLDQKLDSIYKETGVDITIVLLSKMSGYYDTGKKYAAECHDKWKWSMSSSNRPDNSLIIVYNRQKNDFGYYAGNQLKGTSLDSLLVEAEEAAFNSKGLKKGSYYSVFSQLLSDINKGIEIYKQNQIKIEEEAKKKAEEEAKKKAEEEAERRASVIVLDSIFAGVSAIATLVGLFFWVRRKKRMAEERYVLMSEIRTFLNRKTILISLFFVFLYPVVYSIVLTFISFLIDIEAISIMYYSFVVMYSFAFGGWLPAVILMQVQIRKLEKIRAFGRTTPQPVTTPQRENTVRRPERRSDVMNEISSGQQININTATFDQIKNTFSVLTIGEVNKIIQERNANGPYKNVKDLIKRIDFPESLITMIRHRVYFELTPSSSATPSSGGASDKSGGRVIDL